MTTSAIENLKPSEWKPDGDSGPVFTIRPLSGIEMLEVSDHCEYENGMTYFPAKAVETTIRYGLVGWGNFKDKDGKVIEFDNLNPYVNITKLPFVILRKMHNHIVGVTDLGETDAKK